MLRETRRSSELGQETGGEQQEKPELQGEFGHDRAKDLTNGGFTVQFSLPHGRWMNDLEPQRFLRFQTHQSLSLLIVYHSFRSPKIPQECICY